MKLTVITETGSLITVNLIYPNYLSILIHPLIPLDCSIWHSESQSSLNWFLLNIEHYHVLSFNWIYILDVLDLGFDVMWWHCWVHLFNRIGSVSWHFGGRSVSQSIYLILLHVSANDTQLIVISSSRHSNLSIYLEIDVSPSSEAQRQPDKVATHACRPFSNPEPSQLSCWPPN